MSGTIGLDELVDQSELLDRIDRKYLLKAHELPALAAQLERQARTLQIDGLTWFGYQSVYFDTPGLDCYHAAGRGRRRRFKIRTRAYLSTGQHWLEIKTRGPRGTTVKDRIERSSANIRLSSAERSWITETLATRGITSVPLAALRPALVTNYSRRTLQYHPDDRPASRLTIDVGLNCQLPDEDPGGQLFIGLNDYAIIETKGAPRPSPADRLLWTMGHRPISISKYGIGMALLRPDIPEFKWHRTLCHELAA